MRKAPLDGLKKIRALFVHAPEIAVCIKITTLFQELFLLIESVLISGNDELCLVWCAYSR